MSRYLLVCRNVLRIMPQSSRCTVQGRPFRGVGLMVFFYIFSTVDFVPILFRGRNLCVWGRPSTLGSLTGFPHFPLYQISAVPKRCRIFLRSLSPAILAPFWAAILACLDRQLCPRCGGLFVAPPEGGRTGTRFVPPVTPVGRAMQHVVG